MTAAERLVSSYGAIYNRLPASVEENPHIVAAILAVGAGVIQAIEHLETEIRQAGDKVEGAIESFSVELPTP